MVSSTQSQAALPISTEEVRSELERILASAALRRSPQLQRFLGFVVSETLRGGGAALKEYVIGTEVFGRPSTFDPHLDSLVRVEAHRLRVVLERFYQTDGRADLIEIILPKGSYQPDFHRRTFALPAETPSVPPRPASLRWRWPALGAALLLVGILAVYLGTRRYSSSPHKVSTIAVLPFDNLSSDSDNAFFCFGLTDQITTELAKAQGVRVVARTSSAAFKRGDNIPTIARGLRADAVVEGSVQRSNGRLLVNVQLVDAVDNIHLWSEIYERPSVDTLKVQDEISQLATQSILHAVLPVQQTRRPRVHYSANPDANELYWKGLYFRAPMGRTNWRKDLARTAEYLEAAVQKDPKFARAHAALGDVYMSMAWERAGGPVTRELVESARRHALQALEIDSSLAEAYGALGRIQHFYDYDPTSAERSFKQGLQFEPDNGQVRMWYAYSLVMRRRAEEGIAQAKQAKELDPLSYLSTTHVAVVLYFGRHYDEALKLTEETLKVADSAPPHGLRGMIFAAQHKYDDAIREYDAGLRIVPNHPYIKGMLGNSYALSGQRNQARQLLRDANLDYDHGGLSPLKSSYIYLALGETDRALELLEEDYRSRDPELPYINADPVFDSIRQNPRFMALLRKMGE